jgi:hypothetical protein
LPLIKPLLHFWFGFFSLLCRDWVPLRHACSFAALLQCWSSLNSIFVDLNHMEKFSEVIIFRDLQYLETMCNIKVKLIWNFQFLILTETATPQFCAPHECSCHLSSKTDHWACLQSLFHRCSAPKDNSDFLGSSFHIWIMSCTKYTESVN